MGKVRTVGWLSNEFFQFMKEDKRWRMSPVLVLLLIVSSLLIVPGAALAPLI